MDENVSVITCRKCGTRLASTFTKCPDCGTPTNSLGLLCPNPVCRKPIEQDWDICHHCKTSLFCSSVSIAADQSLKQQSANGRDSVTMPANSALNVWVIDLQEGEVLERQYKILKKLDDGGFGSVYVVEDTMFGKKKALKVVVAGDDTIGSIPDLIVHEFELHSQVTEVSHIVRAEGPRLCRHKGLSLVLLPMELADGGDLKQWLGHNQTGEMRLKTGLEFFKQVCLGIKAIHQAGLAHLDIKPGNILLVDGKAKIADFGIGRYCFGQFAKNPTQLLRRGLGTPEYMSPEQFRAPRPQEIGQASDIYSLGIILFEILDGSRPFVGTPLELQDAHMNMNPPSLMSGMQKWRMVVEQCLKKNSSDRYSSIDHLLKDMERVDRGLIVKVDVSCRNCKHINVLEHMINVKKCEKCGEDLPDSFFRVCPGYGKILRCDIEVCSFCKRNVEEYYRLLEQKDCIEQLKDEDPITAIELLNEILKHFREKGDEINYQKSAIQLLNEMEQKQPQIGSLIEQARSAESIHLPDRAIESWQDVLAIITRHRTAKKEIQRIKLKLKEFSECKEKALQCADLAEFEKAEELLEKCDKSITGYQNIKQVLTTCRNRSQKYSIAFNQARNLIESKQIQDATGQLDAAISEAPGSKQALASKEKIEQILQQTKSLLQQAKIQLDRGNFIEVKRIIFSIEQSQIDNTDVLEFKEKIKQIEDSYRRSFENAQKMFNSQNLKEAKRYIEEALALCRNSKQAKDLLGKINEAMAISLLPQIEGKIKSAEFDEAERLLSDAKKLFPELAQLQEIYDTLESTKNKYQAHLKSAKQFKNFRQLTDALREANAALKVCPQSNDAETLATTIKDDIKKRAARKKILMAIVKWTLILLPAVIGFTMSLVFGARDGIVGCCICVAAALINYNRQTRLYSFMYSRQFIKDKKKLLVFVAGILMLISGAFFAAHLKTVAFVLPVVVFTASFYNVFKNAVYFGVRFLFRCLCTLCVGIVNILNIIFIKGTDKLITGLFGFLKRIFTCLAAPFVITARFIHRTYAKTISATKSILTFVRKILSSLFIKTPKAVAIVLFTATWKGRYLKIKLLVIFTGLFLLAVVYVSNKSVRPVSGDKVLYNDKSVEKSFSRHTEVENPVIDKSATEETVAESKIDDVLTKKLATDSRISEQSSINEKFTALVKQANDSYDNGQLRTAIGLYKDVLKVTDDEDVRQRITDIEKKLNDYKDYMDKGYKASLDPASRKLAFEMYQKAKQIWDSQQVNRTIDSLLEKVKSEIDSNLDQAEELILKGDQDTASVKANSALQLAEQMELKESVNRANSILKRINETINPGNLVWHKITTEKVSCIDEVGAKRDINIRYYYNSAGMKFVYIEPKVTSNAQQQSSFYIGADEVTIAQYRTVMGDAPKWFKGDNLPAAGLSWNDATEFCGKLSKKDGLQYNLPTAGQWEYACTAGLNTKYDCGNSITTDYANFSLADGDSVMPKLVGSYPANIWGIYDMHGNVSEWCRDKDGDLRRILKGGSYRDGAEELKVTFSDSDSPRGNARYYGFRVIVEIK